MSAAATAAAGGEEHWLLKSTKSRILRIPPPASPVAAAAAAGHSPPQGLTVCPIKLEACSRRAFRDSVRFQRKFLELRAYEFMGERIHGRRCGDEVELFGFGRDGEETPGLREALEAKGLTIRTFPSPAVSSASSSTTTEGPASPAVRPVASSPPSRIRDPPAPAPVPVPDDAVKKSFLKNCSAKMHSAVVAHELATHEPTPYALIADAEIPGRRRLLGVIVDQAEFEQVCAAHEKGEKGDEQGKVEPNGVLYPILGVYAKGSTVWWRKGEELKGFFGTEGSREVEVVWFSRVKEEAEQARREKRREKKERRREMVAAASTGAAPTSVGAAEEEEEEAQGNEEVGTPAEKPGNEEAQLRAQAKKDKEKARKKAYQARRRQNKKHAKVQEFGGTSVTGPQDKNQGDDEQESSDDNKADKKTYLRGDDLHAILQVLTQRERAAYLSRSRQQLTTTTTSSNTGRRLPTPRFTTMTKRPRIIADSSDEVTEPDTSSSSSSSGPDGEDDAEGEGQQRPNIVHVSSLEEGREAIRQAAAAGSNVVMATMEDLDVMFGRQRRET